MTQRAAVSQDAQLELFVGLAVPAPIPPSSMKWTRKRRPPARAFPIQFAMDLSDRPEVDPDEIEEPGDHFTHVITSATACEMPKTRAPCSIFALAAGHAADQVISEFMSPRKQREEAAPEPEAPQQDTIHRRISRSMADGITRHTAMRYQDTDEWAEKERARRARQKLPKPPKQAFRLRKEVA